MKFVNSLRKQKLLSFTLILFTLSIGVVIGTLVNTQVSAQKNAFAAPGATPLAVPANAAQMQSLFRDLVKVTEPSVVNISTSYAVRPQSQARNNNRRRQAPNEEDGDDMQDYFFRFFGNPFGGGGAPELPQGRRGQALGSGVVVDKAGYILTNSHVVDRADRIQVKFSHDPTEYDAKVIGQDPPTDLAVLKIEAKRDLVAAKIGNSDAVQVGDWAIAIGSPFGFQATVTAGIISAKERDVDPSQQFQHFIQTDAAINPGNSGGPLLNINGEVIGINTAIASRSGGYQGIGFAMPMNTAVKIYNQLIRHGKVTRGSIGISFQPDEASRDLLRAYGATDGVFVQSVAPGGPSDKAGIRAEDIIVAIDGKPVRNGNDLVERVTDTAVGNTLNITVLREKQRRDLKVTVGDLAQIFPDRFGGTRPEDPAPGEGAQARFGMTIENLPEARKQTLGFAEAGGVLITQIEPNSFAEDIQLRRNDILVSINREPVNSVDDVRRIQGALKPGDAVAFRVMRGAPGAGGRPEWTSTFLAGTMPVNP